MEQFKKEEKQIEEDINNVLKDIISDPKSLVVAIVSYDGKVLNSPNEKDMEPYIPHLGPFTKRCLLLARSLDPFAEPLGYTMWTLFGTYSIVFGEEFYAFARQIPIILPAIPPKPIEEMSETERNERQDEEVKKLILEKEQKLKAKEEAAAKLELEKKERRKRKSTQEKEQVKKFEKESSEEDLMEEESESSESTETDEEEEGDEGELGEDKVPKDVEK